MSDMKRTPTQDQKANASSTQSAGQKQQQQDAGRKNAPGKDARAKDAGAHKQHK